VSCRERCQQRLAVVTAASSLLSSRSVAGCCEHLPPCAFASGRERARAVACSRDQTRVVPSSRERSRAVDNSPKRAPAVASRREQSRAVARSRLQSPAVASSRVQAQAFNCSHLQRRAAVSTPSCRESSRPSRAAANITVCFSAPSRAGASIHEQPLAYASGHE